jgi:hypothetical protein
MDTRTRFITASLAVTLALAACAPVVAAPPAPAAAPPALAAAAPPTPRAPDPPRTLAECRAAATSGGEVAPAADLEAQLGALFDARHEMFRCCFDALYAPRAPRTGGTVALLVKLDKKGGFIKAEVVTAESTVQSPEVNACLVDMARELRYPAPPGDRAVGYERIFDFEARR